MQVLTQLLLPTLTASFDAAVYIRILIVSFDKDWGLIEGDWG